MGQRLYVGNLPFSATEDEVRDLFGQNGPGKRGGTVPAYLQNQLANYSAGLERLGGGTTFGFF